MTSRGAKKAKVAKDQTPYDKIERINGEHPFKEKVPFGHVEYQAKQRKKGKILYFNFDLAKEMGLIPKDHPEEMNATLEKKLLKTFSIVIINEYDIINNVKIDPKEVKQNTYMATRYLQLQHPNKQGKTSGDGRSLWNGYFKGNGKTWDITSCGTGATCLSPATAINNKYYKTGDPSISYGCGYSDLLDGICGALLSEIFHLNNIKTERCLLVIEYPGDISINVRAGTNLLRPSHMFSYLKQGDHEKLQTVLDYHIEREEQNKTWKNVPKRRDARYKFFLNEMVNIFSKISAHFESEYIFCWLDWDGDNILMDGGIIDYGSVRQFGLYHHEYRYDDVQRWSTTIKEQRQKAKYIVQTFIQMVDFLLTKEKKNLKDYNQHELLDEFERQYQYYKHHFLCQKIGFKEEQADILCKSHMKSVAKFARVYSVFEKATTPHGIQRVADGVTNNAVFNMRDLLRELPEHFLHTDEHMAPEEFMNLIKTSFAHKENLELTPHRRKQIKDFQDYYLQLVELVGGRKTSGRNKLFKQFEKRGKLINKADRVTGDSIIHVSKKLLRERKDLSFKELFKLMRRFIVDQVRSPESYSSLQNDIKNIRLKNTSKNSLNRMLKIVKEYKEGL